jgi:hypothetical protein
MTILTWTAMVLLADGTPRNSGPDFGKASPFGLLIVVLLLIATFGLVWSMNRHLKKLPESFDAQPPASQPAAGQGSGDGPAAPKIPTQEPGGQPSG